MENDRLKQLWDIQKDFNDTFFLKKLGKKTDELSMDEKISWTKNHLLSIVKEAMEVLDEVPNWKEHRNNETEFILSNLFEEIIDVNKFAVGLAQLWGMDVNQYFEEYIKKSIVVDQRWRQEQELITIDKDKKVCGIDIDGVLGQYHMWFTNYVKTKWGIPVDNFNDIKKNLSPDKYKEIKAAYRQSGWKATMPVIEGASEFTKKLKDAGYQIIILTARPYQTYSRIYSDTLRFLRENDIEFDAIIWDKEKHIKIIKEFPELEFMVDDSPEVAEAVSKQGYPVYVPKTPENELFHSYLKDNVPAQNNMIPIETIADLLDYFN